MDNANPIVYATHASQREDTQRSDPTEWWRDTRLAPHTSIFTDNDEEDAVETSNDVIDAREVFDLVRSITDPEHPLTLEQLAVVNESHIQVDEGDLSAKRPASVTLAFTPTIPHCSMATLIGLSLRVRLLRALPSRYKVNISIQPGTHQSENAINKQLNDKERVAAALENKHLLGVVHGCLASSAQRGAGPSVRVL
ncbi:Cytosolic iron-sulfur assembly component 2B [Malassezia vespertilionis]|uniref:MIP18 family-like domain-containing protein n=1 Tax=Malassezia vespertilionis TaxID=2020962 RepID=A0A2N1JC33_9BASI|nr:Cytosolic iron-sulfur assembly component 2B [Malassezia vespertilionis]PKI84120.1 hypothetical protein MVES_002137 [Malassezia vespertilionis]WFD06911.1 Cytosolic iron-sulfur assembly component 2B [Malassezia vespertilionis]